MRDMPLTPAFADNRAAAHDEDRRALWFWAHVAGAEPGKPVAVFVPHVGLWALDPSEVRDVHSAVAIFEANRGRIEAIASKRFDASGADQGDQHQGQPAITLRANDFDPA